MRRCEECGQRVEWAVWLHSRRHVLLDAGLFEYGTLTEVFRHDDTLVVRVVKVAELDERREAGHAFRREHRCRER